VIRSCTAGLMRVRFANRGSLEPRPRRLPGDRPDQGRRRRVLRADCVTRAAACLGSSSLHSPLPEGARRARVSSRRTSLTITRSRSSASLCPGVEPHRRNTRAREARTRTSPSIPSCASLNISRTLQTRVRSSCRADVARCRPLAPGSPGSSISTRRPARSRASGAPRTSSEMRSPSRVHRPRCARRARPGQRAGRDGVEGLSHRIGDPPVGFERDDRRHAPEIRRAPRGQARRRAHHRVPHSVAGRARLHRLATEQPDRDRDRALLAPCTARAPRWRRR